MKQITADLKKLVDADPKRFYAVKIMATNADVEVGFQYDGDGLYRALQIDPNTKKTVAITPWVNSLTLLERGCAAAGLELADQLLELGQSYPGRKGRKSIFLYVDGVDYGVDVVDLALAGNKTVDAVKRELEQHFAPAQVQFKIEVR